MSELERNLEEVTNLAIETGEKVVTIQCPCCSKTFYALESEANYNYDNPASAAPLKIKHLGRKCPFCGYAGGYDQGQQTKMEQDIEQMRVEMEAEQMAQEAADKRVAPWSQICGQGVKFND